MSVSFPREKFIVKPAGLVKFSYDDELLVAGVGSEVLVVTRQGQLVHNLTTSASSTGRFGGSVWCVAVDQQSTLVAAGHEDGRVSVWSLNTGGLLSREKIFNEKLWGVDFLHNRTLSSHPIIVVCSDTSVSLRRTQDLRKLSTLSTGITQGRPSEGQLQTVTVERSGKYISAGQLSGHVHVWESSAGGEYSLLKTLTGQTGGSAQRVLLHTSSRTMRTTLYAAFQRAIRVWTVPGFEEVATIGVGDTKDIALSEDGTVIASAHLGSSHGRVCLWSLNGDMLSDDSFEDGILGIASTNDGKLLAVRDDAGQLLRLYQD